MLNPNTGVARAHLPIKGIHPRVAQKSKIPWLLATFHNSRWMDQCEVCHGGIEAISILDPVAVEEAYSHIASRYSVYNDMFNHRNCMIRAWPGIKNPWKEDLFFAVKLARQKQSKYYTGVTPMTCMLLIAAHMLHPLWKLRSFGMSDNGMHLKPEDETSYTTQFQEPFVRYVENEFCAKHRRVPVNMQESFPSSNLIHSTTSSGSCQSSFDP